MLSEIEFSQIISHYLSTEIYHNFNTHIFTDKEGYVRNYIIIS